jgi:hypothetical protein
MITVNQTLIVSLSALVITSTPTVRADVIRLADGTILEGELAPPAEVTVNTATGPRQVAFALLPRELQRTYWAKVGEATNDPAPVVAGTPVSDEEIAALANEVNLEVWGQVTAIGSFRDKPEKRGTGGLVVTPAFNALEENWASVYSAKDSVGQSGNWDAQLTTARSLLARRTQFIKKRWLESFVKAGEAVSARDSNGFAAHVRELKRNGLPVENPRNFFTAK